jgi:acyl dehydratase
LHGEQEYRYLGPVRVGDVLTARGRVVDTYTKEGRRGGTMTFTVTETTVTNQHDEVVIWERSTVIVTERATSETDS